MQKRKDPEWEVVDELPSERKKREAARRNKPSLLKNKALWIGMLIGAGIIFIVPVFRVMAINAARAWWIWLGLGVYLLWRHARKNVGKQG